MKKLLILLLVTSTAAAQTPEKAFRPVDEQQYILGSVVFHRGTLTAYLGWERTNMATPLSLLRRDSAGTRHLYRLSVDAHFRGDSVVRFYGPMIADIFDRKYLQGLWVYVRLSNDGLRFSPDSLPAEGEQVPKPTSRGLYIFRDASLVKITDEQTIEALQRYNTEGFYFLPGPGYFYIDIPMYNIR